MPKSVYNPTSNDIFPGTGPRPNSDTVGEFGVRSMFPPDPSGIWLDRGLSGPHSPLLPPVVGTAANSPTVSTLILVAKPMVAQCSHEIRLESGWIEGFRGHIAPFLPPVAGAAANSPPVVSTLLSSDRSGRS